jgi:protein-tyrosine sulfotransferase
MTERLGRSPFSQLFILCTPRSGSSLLRYILDTHPALCCPGEINLGQLCTDLHTAFYYTAGQVLASDEESRDVLAANETRRVINEMMTSYARMKNKQIWCEKTPKNLADIAMIGKVFPDAGFICLYRNCLDVVHSTLEWHGQRGELKNVQSIVTSWIDHTREIHRFQSEHSAHSYGIKYESLVLNPVVTLAGLFAFLDVAFDERLIGQVFSVRHDEGIGDLKVVFSSNIHRNSIGKGSTIKPRTISDVLRERMNAVHRDLEYPEVKPNWDSVPSPYGAAPTRAEQLGRLNSVDDVFTQFMSRQIENNQKTWIDLKGTLKFHVTGNADQSWCIDFDRSRKQFRAEDRDSDCTISVTASDLIKIANGELNPGQCLLDGRLRVTGNRTLAERFGRLLFGG